MPLRKSRIACAASVLVAGCASQSPSTPDTKLSAPIYYSAGQLAETQQNWPRAIAEYKLALTATGPHTPALYRLGIIYTQQKDYPSAIAAWKEYITATYGSATAYGDLAYTCELAGKFADAEAAYHQALAKEPANPTCRINYGRMLARQGKITEAQKQFRNILPEAQIHYDLGVIYEEQKKIPQAQAEYVQALHLNPNLEEAKSRLTELGSPTAAAQ